jgi:hypothetical protein
VAVGALLWIAVGTGKVDVAVGVAVGYCNNGDDGVLMLILILMLVLMVGIAP